MVGWCLVASILLATSVKGQAKIRHPFKLQDKNDVSITDDRQFPANIPKGQTKLYLYLLQQDVEWLSITVTPCSTPLSWDVLFRPSNDTGKVDMSSSAASSALEFEPRSYEENFARRGLYTVRISSPVGDASAQIFATTLGPLKTLRPTTKLTIANKRQKGQISVRWPPSPIDAKQMVYWLVVSPVKRYPSLCKALYEKDMHKTWTQNLVLTKNELSTPYETDLIIEPTGKRTSGAIQGLKIGQTYFVGLFAVNNETHLSYLYANTTTKYQRTKPLPLRDGRPVTANIKRMDGRATFRYKVRNGETSKRIEWYVFACGQGAVVDAEVRQKQKPILARTRVFGYARFVLDNPIPGSTYILRVNSTDPEMLDRINSIQVVGTMRGLQEPILPELTHLYEDKMARGCKSVVLKWLPAKGDSLEYCAVAKEVPKGQEFAVFPDQCAQERMLKNYEYTSSQCFDNYNPYASTIKEEIKYLRRGKTYDVHLTVRNGKSRILSYQTIRVKTRPSCHRN